MALFDSFLAALDPSGLEKTLSETLHKAEVGITSITDSVAVNAQELTDKAEEVVQKTHNLSSAIENKVAE